MAPVYRPSEWRPANPTNRFIKNIWRTTGSLLLRPIRLDQLVYVELHLGLAFTVGNHW